MRFGVFTVALFALALETAAADPPVLERHVISLALDPASNALEATDTLELSGECAIRAIRRSTPVVCGTAALKNCEESQSKGDGGGTARH